MYKRGTKPRPSTKKEARNKETGNLGKSKCRQAEPFPKEI